MKFKIEKSILLVQLIITMVLVFLIRVFGLPSYMFQQFLGLLFIMPFLFPTAITILSFPKRMECGYIPFIVLVLAISIVSGIVQIGLILSFID